ncbi:hypothetical protein [Brevundimonas sp.]|jgi:hypothetical protein|uniref:hypothetical protein n=1 Tax=Brevundimonas sp. TaxID=1871086 RepID=UPI0025C21592|nr:hypothetical protein [Brevundimonas sp.]
MSVQKIYPKSMIVLLKQSILLTILIFLLYREQFPAVLFSYMDTPPGLYLFYLIWLGVAVIFLLRLPETFRALFRIPAVEFDGQHLLIRGWRDRTFNVSEGHPLSYAVSTDGKRVQVLSNGVRSDRVTLEHVDGPATLLRLLDEIAKR